MAMYMNTPKDVEDKREALLQIRASLGCWQKGEFKITITDREVTPQMDLRQYAVVEERGSYKTPFRYNVTARDVAAKIKTFQQTGYKLVAPQYGELAAFFRNGRPVTAMDIFEDAIDEIEVTHDDRTGLEFLMDFYKHE